MEITRELYEDALGAELPDAVGDTVEVGRTGYSTEVAEELGDDYMEQELFIFSPVQADAPVYQEEEEAWGRLLDATFSGTYQEDGETYRNIGFIERVTEYGPLVLELELKRTPRRVYKLSISPTSQGGMAEFQSVYDMFEEVEQLDKYALQDESGVEELLSRLEETDEDYEAFHNFAVPSELGRLTVHEFEFRLDGLDGTVSRSTATIGDTEFDLSPLHTYSHESWPLIKEKRGTLAGLLKHPALVENVHGPVNVAVFPSDEEPELPPEPEYLPTDGSNGNRVRLMQQDLELRSREKLLQNVHRHYDADDEQSVVGSIRSVHDDVNILTTSDVQVYHRSGHGSVRTHGKPSDSPAYHVWAQSVHEDVNIYYLPLDGITSLDAPSLPQKIWENAKGFFPLMPRSR